MHSKLNLILSLVFISFLFSCSGNHEFDLLITNARIVDGTGSDAYSGHILVDDGLIAATGDFETDTVRALRIIDAAGRTVSPGFIDPHSHGDPFETPRFDNFLAMGVTTIALGQDGSSPMTRDVSAWMDRIDSLGTGVNILHFTGHGTLRHLAGAPRQPDLPDSILNEMVTLMESAMRAGSFGLTTGLEYESGRYATMRELTAIAGPVAAHDGLVMSHLRSEDDTEIEAAVQELIQQGKGSGARVHVSHIKIVYANEASRADDVIRIMDGARQNGVSITADLYPYTASYTGIGIVFPDWVTASNFETVKKTRRGELEEYLRNRIAKRNGPEATLFGTHPWAGMTLAEVADSLNKPFEDVLIDDIGPAGAGAAYFVMNDRVMKRFLTDPHIMISSDGSPAMHHPRGYGSFAKIIDDYVVQEPVLTLEEAIHKMTGLTAETLGLTNPARTDIPRGLLKTGYAADILIFDHTNIKDMATFEQPHLLAEGIDWVFVNGVGVLREGELNRLTPAGAIRFIPD